MAISELEVDQQITIVKKKTIKLILTSLISAFIFWKIIQFNLVGSEIKNGVGWVFIIALVSFFVISHKITYNQKLSKSLAYPLAISIGVFIGCVSGFFERVMSGIVIQVIFLTFGSTLSLIWLYRNKIIKVNNHFIRVLSFLILSLSWIMIINFIMSIIDLNWHSVFQGVGWVAIAINFLMLISVYMLFMLDLNIIQMKTRMNRYNEEELSFFSVELLLDLLWVYLTIFALVAKLKGRKS